MYISLQDIQELQLDHTSRCNLACPQCARTQDGWSSSIEQRNLDLNLEDYQILLEPFPRDSLSLFHCGNFGDAVASPTFDETLRFSLSKEPKRITISSNGALRAPSWWRSLAEMGGSKLFVNFAIDGLADTNSIYRIGANWDRIMQNVKAFIGAGGRARWDFIEFEHNYHQISEAEKLARDLGFEKFNIKYTARFASIGSTHQKTSQGHDVKDRPDNINRLDRLETERVFGTFDQYVERTKISCKYKQKRAVFVDMNMRLWPCCWMGAPLYFTGPNKQTESFQAFLKVYGRDFNSLRMHGWSVLEHDFFRIYLEKSWHHPDLDHPRIYTCGRTCGEKFEFSSGYGQNSRIQIIRSQGDDRNREKSNSTNG